MQKLKNLLATVANLSRLHTKIAFLRGENYNVFQTLNLGTSEVRMHSAFLADLLNPKGSHGLGDSFLTLFCEELDILDFDPVQAIVSVEKFAGVITPDELEGGKIDILIVDRQNRAIIIENKIHAGDQTNQLQRYANYGINSCKSHKLLYLTLDGKPASKESRFNLAESDYTPLSYATDILNWLERCIEKAALQPILRETIVQYTMLIRTLTHQTTNIAMSQDIANMITTNGENTEAAFAIAGALNKSKSLLLTKFGNAVKDKVEKLNSDYHVELHDDFGQKLRGMIVRSKNTPIHALLLSFLSHQSDFYIEIVNLENKSGYKTKEPHNYLFFSEKLNRLTGSWGKIEDMTRAWHGDWVCRYYVLDNFFRTPAGWAAVANDEHKQMASEVAEHLLAVMKAIDEKAELVAVEKSA